MRAVLVICLVAACYAPSPQPGAPCPDGVCPTPLVCSPITATCEPPDVMVDAAPADVRGDRPLIDGCTPAPELCGDGEDQDCNGEDPACAANDRPGDAIDITAGGTFAADLAFAHDDVAANGCSGDGGRDLFYSVDLAAPRVFYFDTFGSSFGTVIRVYARSCATVGTGADARACQAGSCNTAQSQLAVSLPAGESCVVIDQESASETSGSVTLKVIAGSRNGTPLAAGMRTISGDTAGASNVMDPSDTNCDAPGSNGKDVAYFFTACPGESMLLDAETCAGATWDTVLYVRRGNTTQIGCNDDACDLQTRLANVTISNGELFWLVVDGFDATHSGAFTLTTNLR